MKRYQHRCYMFHFPGTGIGISFATKDSLMPNSPIVQK